MSASSHGSERWRQIEEIFQEALEREPGQRQQFLDLACGSDEGLRSEVEGLLAADTAAGDFLEQAVAGGSSLLQDTATPLAGGRLLGKYEVLEHIGEGGFGAVYKGLDTVLQRHVAIKVCTSRRGLLRERFLREAEIAAALQHPNVTTLHDLGFDGEIPFLVQEFLEGEDLEAKILRRDPLSLEERLSILLQVARGLEYAHGQGVVHRDVKPANVRILPNGQAKIMDFGIARLLGQDSGLTQEGEALGTVGYLAPEQLKNDGVDQRADLFAFGVLAYELLAYARPFVGDSFSQVSYQVLYEEPEPLSNHLPHCPPELDRIVGRCLAKDRRRRYGQLTEVIGDLEALVGSMSIGTGDLTTEGPRADGRSGLPFNSGAGSPRRGGWLGRRRTATTAAGIVIAAAAVIAWLGSLPAEDAEGGGAVSTGLTAEAAGTLEDSADSPPGSPYLPAEEDGAGPGRRSPPEPPADSSGAPGLSSPEAEGSRGSGIGGESPRGVPSASGSPPETSLEAAQPDGGGYENPGAAGRGGGGHLGPQGETSSEGSTDGGTAGAAAGSDNEGAALPESLRGRGAAQSPVAEDTLPAGRGVIPESSEQTGAEEPAAPSSGEERLEAPSSGSPLVGSEPPSGETGTAPSRAATAEGDGTGAAASELLTAGDGVLLPEILDRPAPAYPERARLRRREARVVVAVLVDAAGRVEHALVKSGGGGDLGFEEAALAAARQASFRPASRDGVPGKMWTELSFDFVLE